MLFGELKASKLWMGLKNKCLIIVNDRYEPSRIKIKGDRNWFLTLDLINFQSWIIANLDEFTIFFSYFSNMLRHILKRLFIKY